MSSVIARGGICGPSGRSTVPIGLSRYYSCVSIISRGAVIASATPRRPRANACSLVPEAAKISLDSKSEQNNNDISPSSIAPNGPDSRRTRGEVLRSPRDFFFAQQFANRTHQMFILVTEDYIPRYFASAPRLPPPILPTTFRPVSRSAPPRLLVETASARPS